jgi:membrane associated rhomboid family serine protease/Zn-finger nucleic acid-binding protein
VLTCPRCRTALDRIQGHGSNYWECASCHGHAISLALLRKRVEPATINRLWQDSHGSGRETSLPCPACLQSMREVPFATEAGAIPIDTCQRCHFLWLDGGEMQQLPSYTPPPSVEEKLPQEAREALALWEVERIRERAEREEAARGELPDHSWQVLAGVLGMPVEHDASDLRRQPVATWGVSAVIVAVSCLIFVLGEEALRSLAFIPAQPWRLGGLTWLTSFFVHAGMMHLVGNVYFLLVFGDNVEDLIGRKRFLAVLFLSTLAGDILHWLFEPRGTIPTVGASGGISGIIALYALAFPQARLGTLVRFTYVHFSARAGFILWLLLQIAGVWLQVSGDSPVSALAHLGGCLVGIGYWYWVVRAKAPAEPAERFGRGAGK